MRSIKPGRGPSMKGGIASLFGALFGVFWTITAIQMGAPTMFWLFGVIFVLAGIAEAIYHFKNALGKNRFSEFDITEQGEESDPMDELIAEQQHHVNEDRQGNYCPYCGNQVEGRYEFCPRCGKKLPEHGGK